MKNLFVHSFFVLALFSIGGFTMSCGGSDDDSEDLPDYGGKQTSVRLASIDGQALNYDNAGYVTSISTSRWGNVWFNITSTFSDGYVSQFIEDGERFAITWSDGNPAKMGGYDFESVAAYGESCNNAAICTAFNLYAMMYGDAYKTHALGVLYGNALNGALGKNAKRLATHVEYHETDDSEYDDMVCDYQFSKDRNGLVTLITMKIKTNSYKGGKLLSSKEKTQTIKLDWEEQPARN